MDTDVLDAHLDSVSRSEACDVNHFDSAFTNAFLKTDEEFGKVQLLPVADCQAFYPANSCTHCRNKLWVAFHHRSM